MSCLNFFVVYNFSRVFIFNDDNRRIAHWTRRRFSDNDAILPRLFARRQPRRSPWLARLRWWMWLAKRIASVRDYGSAKTSHTNLWSQETRAPHPRFSCFQLSNTFGKLRKALFVPYTSALMHVILIGIIYTEQDKTYTKYIYIYRVFRK